MKKILCAVLAFTLMLSSVFAMNVSAATYADDIDALYNEGKLSGVDTAFKSTTGDEMATALNSLYNSTNTLVWDSLDVTKGDLALACGNANIYLKRLLNQKYAGGKLFLDENADGYATSISHFLYKMFYIFNATDELQARNVVFEGSQAVPEEDFYQQIAIVSGFADLLQSNWCDANVDFVALVELFGLSKQDILASDYKTGYQLGGKILKYSIEKILNVGPIEYIVNIVSALSTSYAAKYQNAAEALLKIRINSLNGVSAETLSTFTGVLNLIFNNLDSSRTDCLQFCTLPEKRIAAASGETEVFLYLLTYLNINSKYANNESLLRGYFNDYASILLTTGSTQEDSNVIKGFYYSVLLADYMDSNASSVSSLGEFVTSYKDMYQSTWDNAPNDIMNSIYNSIISFFRAIAQVIDNWLKIFSGEKEFG